MGARAQADEALTDFSVPRQPLSAAISSFAAQSGYSITYGFDINAEDRSSPPLMGRYTVANGLKSLLSGTGYEFREIAPRTILIRDARSTARATTGPPSPPGPTGAEFADPEYEEIVVRSLGRQTFLMDVPAAVTVFSAEDITIARMDRVEDFLPRVPNTAFTGRGQRTQMRIAVRGISNLFGDDQPASYLVNGINIARNNPNPLLYDAERIEVIRGPQATSYGRNTLGGLISVELARARPDFEARVGLEVSRFLNTRLVGHINGPVSQNFWLRVCIFGELGDSGARNLAPEDPDGHDSGIAHIRVTSHWQASDRISMDLSISYGREHDDELHLVGTGVLSPSVEQLIGAGFPAEPDGLSYFPENQRFTAHDFPNRWDMESWFADLQTEYAGNRFTILAITGYFSNNDSVLIDSDSSTLNLLGEHRSQSGESLSQEIRVQSRNTDVLSWQIGGLASVDRRKTAQIFGTFNAEFFPSWPAPRDLEEPFHDLIAHLIERRKIEAYALFSEFAWTITTAVTATAGFRYQYDRVVRQQLLLLTNFAGYSPSSETYSRGFGVFLPRLSVQASLSDNLMIFLSGAKGFKPGGVEGLLFEEPRPFDGERVWSIEAGIRARLWNDRAMLAVTGFYMDWNRLQVPLLLVGRLRVIDVPATTYSTGTAGSASSFGAELEFTLNPLPELDIRGSVGYLRARFGDVPGFAGDLGPDVVKGLPMVLSPTWTASVDIEYRRNLSREWVGFLRGEWNYRSSMLASIFFLGADGFPERTPGRNVVNLRVGLARGNLQITAFVENAFDVAYYATFDDESFQSFTGALVQPNPRTFGLQVSATF